jgi:phage shock protein C
MLMNRRLTRCREDRLIAGVAAGVAEYFDLDPSLVRILWFLSIFLGGLGLFLYIGMAIIVPLESHTGEPATDETTVPAVHRHSRRGEGRLTTFVGGVLILFGALALSHQLLPDWDIERYLVPAVAIAIGTVLVVTSIRREPMRQ